MSVQFSGWKVYDSLIHHGEWTADHKPHKRGTYTMYHGTSVANAKLIISNGFKQSSTGLLGPGVYVSRDILKAGAYPKGSKCEDRVILQLSVRLGRVKRICKDDDPLLTTWNQHGYDTAWVPPNCNMTSVPSGLQENCVFDPTRVEVVGISRAANNTIEKELLALLKEKQKNKKDHSNRDVCSLCNRKTHRAVPHIIQRCWSCNKRICPLMIEHKCQARP